MDRYSRIAEQVERDDKDGLIELRRPRTATREEILLVHQCDYVDRFLHRIWRKEKFVELVCVHGSQKLSRTMRLVGGAIEGLDLLFAGMPIAGNMQWGYPSCFRAEGAGYCIFNDLAVCAEIARRRDRQNLS